MSAVDDILRDLPVDQIAARLGATPDEVHDAAYAALPALLGGLQANAEDPAGEQSLLGALSQHEAPVSADQVDLADGERATRHIFGDRREDVVAALGSTGANPGLISRLLPLLAPIVLSYLAKRMGQSGGAGGAGGLLGMLQQLLQGAVEGTSTTSGNAAMPGFDSILSDVLGGMLGGGRRA